jgi:hypothetical protein
VRCSGERRVDRAPGCRCARDRSTAWCCGILAFSLSDLLPLGWIFVGLLANFAARGGVLARPLADLPALGWIFVGLLANLAPSGGIFAGALTNRPAPRDVIAE